MRRLPPFAALRAFEAAARHNNFKLAAEDLCLSSSAVSHQVRSLEEFLGVQLFHREKGKPQLTSIGAAYLEDIQDIFQRLEKATTSVTERASRPSLVLHLLHSLASCWLLPLLADFKKQYPDMGIKLLSSTDTVEFSGDIDAGIRYGDGNWRGLRSDFLMGDELFLVCSPEIAPTLPPIDQLEKLVEEHTLIHCSLDQTEWSSWLEASGATLPNEQNILDLDSRGLVLEAAAGGLGIAIGRMPYVANFLKSGRLVAPYSVKVNTNKGYYLVYPEHHASYDTVVSLREWLLSQNEQ